MCADPQDQVTKFWNLKWKSLAPFWIIPSCALLQRFKSTRLDEEIDLDEPIKFSTSKAATWKSEELYISPKRDAPWNSNFQTSNYRVVCFSSNVIKFTGILKDLPLLSNHTQIRPFSKLKWDAILKSRSSPNLKQFSFLLLMAVFFSYIIWFRKENYFEELNCPIWEKYPGIDPEKAEKIMHLDRYSGVQVDFEGLEKYKEKYYLKQGMKLESSEQIMENVAENVK